MKKIFLINTILFFFLILTYSNINAQKENCIGKGKSIVDVYYGFPNFYSTIIEQGYNNDFDLTRGIKPDYDITDLGPFGAKYEYLLTEEIGIGVNLFYANTTMKWSDELYNYKTSVSRLRIAITGNYHFYTTKKFDPYFTAHIGYANFDYQFEQESIINNIPSVHPKPDIKFMFPIALRVGIGARYFFKPNFGVNAEFGLGGILLTGGVSYKF